MKHKEQKKLLTSEREKIILNALSDTGNGISELSKKVNVSEATVRRDLQSLEQQGKVKRVHGGAVLVKKLEIEPLYTEKASQNALEKTYIANLALELINDSDTIYLDGGSTIVQLAKLLDKKNNLTIVTNSLAAIAELVKTEHNLIFIGGEVRKISRTVVGTLTNEIISKIQINKAFLGTFGFTIEDGISTTEANEAYTKELVMKKANEVIVIADSSKLGTPSFVASGKISDIDILITDKNIDAEFAEQLKEKNIRLIK